MSAPRPLAEAIAEVVAAGRPRETVHVALDAAHGRVLREDVVAARALPPWANAGMDGYAVQADDVRGASAVAPVRLRVIGTIAAGTMPTAPVTPGTAMRIFTGAPMPAGADSVVRWEDTDRGPDVVTVRHDRDAGRNVRPAGEDAAAGAVALAAGTRLTPAALQHLASLGVSRVPVARAPVVAVLRSGDELVPLSRAADAGAAQIIDSNGIALAAIIANAGGTVLDGGLVPDDEAALATALEAAARQADLIVSAGGVAAGAFDFAKAAVARAGGTMAFWKVAARPGSQLAFGAIGDVPWLGLPGNPVSSTVCGELFVRPLVRAMLGDPRPHRRAFPMPTAAPLPRDARATLLVRVVLEEDALRSAGGQGSHLVGPLARSDGLAAVPPGDGPLPTGTRVAFLPWGGEATTAQPPFGEAVA